MAGQRPRGTIETRGSSLRIRVYAGEDPVTSKPAYLRETVPGTDAAARRKATKVLHRLVADAEREARVSTAALVSRLLDEWLRVAELEESTRTTYVGYIERVLKPALGTTPLNRLTARHLESLHAELRRCRERCSRTTPDHVCRPLAESTIRQMHSILSGAFAAAVRWGWGWVETNPVRVAQRPRARTPDPDPPSPTEAAKLVDEAFAMAEDWGTLVWLVMTTGMRRGELCALRWSRVDLDNGEIDVRASCRLHRGVGTTKDTKTHRMRRIALGTETVGLLRSHRRRWEERLASLGETLTEDMYVFTNMRSPVPTTPYSPHGVSSRYKAMAERLEIDTHLHALRHYSATELLSTGVDLRTVAGRLGHGGGGATTLRVYAAWVAASDRKAAEILGSHMPKVPRRDG